MGERRLFWLFFVFAFVSGIVSLAITRWMFASFGLTEMLLGWGIPSLLVFNIPELIALKSAAGAGAFYSFSWGVEGRVLFANRWSNADDRASIIDSVVDTLSYALLDAVPDMSDYAHSGGDDRSNPISNPIVERALGAYNGHHQKAKPLRREPKPTSQGKTE